MMQELKAQIHKYTQVEESQLFRLSSYAMISLMNIKPHYTRLDYPPVSLFINRA